MAFEIILDKEEIGTSVWMKDLDSGCQAVVSTLGAFLKAFAVPIQGEYFNIVESYIDNNEAAERIETDFRGVKLSPFVGKMKRQFSFSGSDRKIENADVLGFANNGFMHSHLFEIVETKKTIDAAEVKMKGFYSGTDKGYPFTYLITVTYRLTNGNKLSVETCVQHFNEHSIPYGDGWNTIFGLAQPLTECNLEPGSKVYYEFEKNLNYTRKEIAEPTLDYAAERYYETKCATFNDEFLKLTIDLNEGYRFLHVHPASSETIVLACLSMLPDAFHNGEGLLILEPTKKYIFSCTYTLETL